MPSKNGFVTCNDNTTIRRSYCLAGSFEAFKKWAVIVSVVAMAAATAAALLCTFHKFLLLPPYFLPHFHTPLTFAPSLRNPSDLEFESSSIYTSFSQADHSRFRCAQHRRRDAAETFSYGLTSEAV